MLDALITTKTKNYLGSINQWSLSLEATPLELGEIESLILKSGDLSSILISRDGTTRPLYARRALWRPRLLLNGALTLRPPGAETPLTLDVREVTYMMLKSI